MTEVPQVRLPRPYLIFVGDAQSAVAAKTGAGVYHWAPDACTAQWRLGADACDIGLPDRRPAEAEARALCAANTGETGLPTTDPMRFGVEPILERMLAWA